MHLVETLRLEVKNAVPGITNTGAEVNMPGGYVCGVQEFIPL